MGFRDRGGLLVEVIKWVYRFSGARGNRALDLFMAFLTHCLIFLFNSEIFNTATAGNPMGAWPVHPGKNMFCAPQCIILNIHKYPHFFILTAFDYKSLFMLDSKLLTFASLPQ